MDQFGEAACPIRCKSCNAALQAPAMLAELRLDVYVMTLPRISERQLWIFSPLMHVIAFQTALRCSNVTATRHRLPVSRTGFRLLIIIITTTIIIIIVIVIVIAILILIIIITIITIIPLTPHSKWCKVDIFSNVVRSLSS
jgi:hypothetical protein